jgi:hypothetical protein
MIDSSYLLVMGYILAYVLAHVFWIRKQDASTRSIFKWTLQPLMWGWLLTLELTDNDVTNAALGYFLGLTIVMVLERFLTPSKPSKKVRRGTEIIPEKDAIAWLGSEGHTVQTCDARIGRIPIPFDVENLGFLCAGTPGSGKTQAFLQMMESSRRRGHGAVVADLGGEFASLFYRRGKDAILNPFDSRGVAWSPFAEMREFYDAARIASSMIPEGFGQAKEFNFYVRTIIEVILETLFARGDDATNANLCYYTLGADWPELAKLCEGTAAANFFSEGNERLLGSIKTIMSAYLKPYTYLRPETGRNGFSIRQMVESSEDRWIFVTYRDDQRKALRTLISAQLDVAIGSLLASHTDLQRRYWFYLDEFYTIGFVDSMESLLSLARKKGGAPVLGLHSFSQLREAYGKDKAQTILASLGNWLILKQADVENEKYLIDYLGQQEISKSTKSQNKADGGNTEGWSEQDQIQPALLKGELKKMGPRVGILNLSNAMPPAWTRIPIAKLKPTTVPFVDVPNLRPMRIVRLGLPVSENPLHPKGVEIDSGPHKFDV